MLASILGTLPSAIFPSEVFSPAIIIKPAMVSIIIRINKTPNAAVIRVPIFMFPSMASSSKIK
jgi:hypothetical protein